MSERFCFHREGGLAVLLVDTKKLFRLRPFVLQVLLAVWLIASATVAMSAQESQASVPDGFDKYMVFMSSAIFTPPTLEDFQLRAYLFHRLVMGRTNEQTLEHRAAAIDFFKARFGLDPDALENQDRLKLVMSSVIREKNYRVFTISDEMVPASGWLVRDGGWQLEVTDPLGITLGGEFSGMHVPVKTAFMYGDYNIRALRPSWDPGPTEIIIRYQAGSPVIPNEDGSVMFRCEVFSDEYGTGLAQGISAPVPLGDGTIRANNRNVLTFPGLGHPPD